MTKQIHLTAGHGIQASFPKQNKHVLSRNTLSRCESSSLASFSPKRNPQIVNPLQLKEHEVGNKLSNRSLSNTLKADTQQGGSNIRLDL